MDPHPAAKQLEGDERELLVGRAADAGEYSIELAIARDLGYDERAGDAADPPARDPLAAKEGAELRLALVGRE